jgi:iron complex transport system substrate-binding protein
MRVVSLVPSITQTVVSLGGREMLVGCTSFCVDPPGLAKKIRIIGGTKNPDILALQQLRPDLILCNSEENRPEDIAACREFAPVLESFPRSPWDVPPMIKSLGEALDKAVAANAMAYRTQKALEELQEAASRFSEAPGMNFVYLIWRNPWMAAGKGTYIDSFLSLAGFSNAISSPRYPTLADEDPASLDVDYVFFSSEPWPFRKRDSDLWVAAGGIKGEKLRIDGKSLSWHGVETEKTARDLRLWIKDKTETSIIRQI